MAKTATPIVTDFSVETIRKFALSNKSFVKAAANRRELLQAQINQIDYILGKEEKKPTATKLGRPAKKAKVARKANGRFAINKKAKVARRVKKAKTARSVIKKRAGRPAVKASAGTGRRGRPTKGKTSLKDAVLSIIRANGGKIETNEIINHLKQMGFDVSAKSIGVMIQHSLRALAEEGLISRAERGFASITVRGSVAAAVIVPPSVPTASVSISAA